MFPEISRKTDPVSGTSTISIELPKFSNSPPPILINGWNEPPTNDSSVIDIGVSRTIELFEAFQYPKISFPPTAYAESN